MILKLIPSKSQQQIHILMNSKSCVMALSAALIYFYINGNDYGNVKKKTIEKGMKKLKSPTQPFFCNFFLSV